MWLVKLSDAPWFGYFTKSLLLLLFELQTGCFDNNLFEFSEVIVNSKSGTEAFPMLPGGYGLEGRNHTILSLIQKPLESGLCVPGSSSAVVCILLCSVPWTDLSLGSRLGSAAWRPTALQEPKQSAQLALDPITHSSSRDLHHPSCRLRGMIAGVEGIGFS